jgi:TRAP-type C4-dicarboxylate transport system permease small subunit
MKKIFHEINQILSAFCGWLILLMMVLLCLDIASRSLGHSLQGIAVLSVMVMVIVIYLGLARCEEHQEHVRLELFLDKLPDSIRKMVEMVMFIIEFATVGAFLYAVYSNALHSFVNSEAVAGTVQIPLWPVKWLMVIGLFFYLVQVFIKCWNGLKGMKGEERTIL